ncbi:MAG: hypothetical protein IID44_10990 [Planctomycetes bacterium]|nr:hypothetical protein [Planctomycetota bacterium]
MAIRLKKDGTADKRFSNSVSAPRYLPSPKEIADGCAKIRSANLAKLEARESPRGRDE